MCLYLFGICHGTKFVSSSAGLSFAIFRRNVTEITVLRKDILAECDASSGGDTVKTGLRPQSPRHFA